MKKCILLVLFLFALHVDASTLVVGSCEGGKYYSTIKSAIKIAKAKDTVEICEGIYNESVDISKKNLTLRGIGNKENIVINSGSLVGMRLGDDSKIYNLKIISKSDGIVSVSNIYGKHIFKDLIIEAGNRGIYIENGTEHSFENLKINSRYSSIYLKNGATFFKNLDLTSTNSMGISINNSRNNIIFQNITIKSMGTGIEASRGVNGEHTLSNITINSEGIGLNFELGFNYLTNANIISKKNAININENHRNATIIEKTYIDTRLGESGIVFGYGAWTKLAIRNCIILAKDIAIKLSNSHSLKIHNVCIRKAKIGIYLAPYVSDATIYDNKITNTSEYDLKIESNYSSAVKGNCFYGNVYRVNDRHHFYNNYWANLSVGRAMGDDTPLRTCTSSCGGEDRSLIADYRFDECIWDGTAKEVKDNSLNHYDGRANEATTSSESKINRAGDFSENSKNDYLSLDYRAMNGLNDFSIGMWIKTSNEGDQQEILHALGDSVNDDEFELYLEEDETLHVNIKNNGQDFDVEDYEITDGKWHQIFLTRKSRTVCLYVDGKKSKCQSGFKTGRLEVHEKSLIVGQEQDSYGGDFKRSQNFVGLMDELKIFNTKLTDEQIKAIYNYENSGKNYDGTVRIIKDCPFVESIVEYRFDECVWNGTVNEVKDNSLNHYDGRANKATTSSESKINRAGDFSENSKNDYVSLDYRAMNGLNDFSLGVWIKTSFERKQQEIIHGLGNSVDDDEFELYLYYDKSIHVKIKDQGESFDLEEYKVTDGKWHQIFLTRKYNMVCLYVDGKKLECEDEFGTGHLNIYKKSLILGQEQDSHGGKFNIKQNFVGLMDELKIFNTKLTDKQIKTIYGYENSGKNYDGSFRTKTNCKEVPLNPFFDALDIFRNINDRNISTKKVSQNFDLNIIALNEKNNALQEYKGSVQARIVQASTCPKGNDYLSSFVNVDLLNKKDKITFNVTKAVKDARVQIKTDDNITCSSDNFAIRPISFNFTLPNKKRAGEDFNIDFKAENGVNYNETKGNSFEIETNILKNECLKGSLHVETFSFENGEKEVSVNYNEVGDVNVRIHEIHGSEFAKVDADDTNDENRLIMEHNRTMTILTDHFNITASFKNYYNDFTYLSRDLNMSAKLKLDITAKNRQNVTTKNYNDSCYAKSIDINILHSSVLSNNLDKILYIYSDENDINSTKVNITKSLDINLTNYDKTHFSTDDNGTAEVTFFINFDRDKTKTVSPFYFNITNINVTDKNDTKGTKELDQNTFFYYGRVKTQDIRTNKKSINNSLHVEVYKLGKYRQSSLNWYVNEDDNNSTVTLKDKKTFLFNSQNAYLADIGQKQIKNGTTEFTLSHNENSDFQSYIHLDIPEYLWYNKYESYNKLENCSTHPCFKYEFFKIDGNHIHSGDFSGSSVGFDFNATNVKRGVKTFR